MGLIFAGINAIGGTLASQWREYFYANAMPSDVLVTKGMKRINGRFGGSRTEDDNVISSGSAIVVNEGQCLLIVDQGRIVDFCAEPGVYTFENNAEPSLLYGELGKEKFKSVLKSAFDRFCFGGQAGMDQRVYYFNLKEITGNKYGTPNAIPFRVVDQNIGLDIDISIRCFGEYSYRITNPILFYTNVCGNVLGNYRREQIDNQLKMELLTALQPAFGKISNMGVRYSNLPNHTVEISQALNEVLSEKWTNLRGVEIVSFAINSITASEDDEAIIKGLQRDAVFRDPNMAAAHMIGAQAQAMQSAAQNESGAFTGFLGMNLVQGNTDPTQLYQMGAIRQVPRRRSTNTWKCKCGTTATGKFCPECGSKKLEDLSWLCRCGNRNTGKFCTECGTSKPSIVGDVRCKKCGYMPETSERLPKFCPECGEVFN